MPVIEGVALNLEVNGDDCITAEYLDSQNRVYFAESNIAQNGIFISFEQDFSDITYSTESGLTLKWKPIDNLSQALSGQLVYKFGVDAVNNACYIQFPDDIGTLIKDGLYIKYIKSSGLNGNVTAKTISQFFSNDNAKDPEGLDIIDVESNAIKLNDLFTYITNLSGTMNGLDPMTIDEMNLNYDKVKNVFDTLVSLLDYKNYLYEYKDSQNNNIVSNIQVSDRTNDLYKSYLVKSFDAENKIHVDILKSNAKDEDSVDTSTMSPYAIRFFPLKSVVSVESLKNFDATFEYLKDYQDSIGVDDASSVINKSIKNVKSLNHERQFNGEPIIVTYDLEGQIYLNNKVS